MDARQLLEMIHERGGVATVKLDGDAAKINVSPRSLALDLLPDLQRFKPALLELLTAPEPPATPSPFRRVNEFCFVPAKIDTAPGAAAICEVLQSFCALLEAARGGDLPTDALDVEISGEPDTLENPASEVAEIESLWSEKARLCQRGKRDLTPEEKELLDGAAEIFNHVWACYDGPGAAWLDLGALNRQLDAGLLPKSCVF